MTYRAPLKEMFFVLDTLAGLEAINRLPGFEEASRETAYSVLEEAAKFSEQVVAPLNRVGDLEPSRWQEEEVITTPGFKRPSSNSRKADGREFNIRNSSVVKGCRS